ncbi:MAG: GNAT family N-acetyltransferase [Candidatus Manganitrophaceae bacterium]|nr:MAG: GNAT family N-acetyltransferase [Candidatus Manganitrophaceae bacterium]
MIDLEEVTTVEALEALRPEWSALYERCAGATPFQSPEWLLSWWKCFGAGQLWVLVLRRGGRLVGLAPFFIGSLGEGAPRHVGFIGTGITDTLDLLLEPGLESVGALRILERLAQCSARWDLCDFQELRPDSALLTASRSALHFRIVPQSVSPRLLLPEGTNLETILPPVHRRNLRRARRRLEAAGRFVFDRADAHTFPALLEDFFRLHENRWEKREGAGVLADPAIRAFHREAAAGFLRQGALRLYGLRLGETVIASLYAFRKGSGLYCYLSGFDPEKADYSPGALLLKHAIEEAIGEGLREVDFLRGKEPYKYLWGASDRVHYRLWIAPVASSLPQGSEEIDRSLKTG